MASLLHPHTCLTSKQAVRMHDFACTVFILMHYVHITPLCASMIRDRASHQAWPCMRLRVHVVLEAPYHRAMLHPLPKCS